MGDMGRIRVMIVDDHTMVRRGLASILRVKSGLELVGEASNGLEAVQICQQVQPDVILMDLVMPEMDGAAATRAIRAQCPRTQVIALTSFKEKELVQSALDAGAIGYLLKNVSADELAEAIRAAHAGHPTLAPEVTQILTQAEKLERLARALVDAPADASTLPDLLKHHVPDMFPDSQIEIQIFPDLTLLHHPTDWPPVPRPVWEWLRRTAESHSFLPGMELPWEGPQQGHGGLLLAPILTTTGSEPIGGIYLCHPVDPVIPADRLPMVKSLAAQIASTLLSAQVYSQTLAHAKLARELAMAGQIQASFLPGELPDLPNWQLAVKLEPARETSGDFYDLIPLPDGHLGVVIADVSDKGLGAALYMALSRTLIRTYAAEYPGQPDLVLAAANHRILSDARAGLFVTVFYGSLDLESGSLTYCNAGHNPPLLLSTRGADAPRALNKTGMALGAIEDTTWHYRTAQVQPGEALILYTDGIVEANDQNGEAFGKKRLIESLQSTIRAPGTLSSLAQQMQDALLAEVHQFVGDAPQSDDMTLVTLIRDL